MFKNKTCGHNKSWRGTKNLGGTAPERPPVATGLAVHASHKPVVSVLDGGLVFLPQLHHAFFSLVVQGVQFADLHLELVSLLVQIAL